MDDSLDYDVPTPVQYMDKFEKELEDDFQREEEMINNELGAMQDEEAEIAKTEPTKVTIYLSNGASRHVESHITDMIFRYY